MKKLTAAILFLIALFVTGLQADEKEPAMFPVVSGPCGLSLPKDHGAHPDYRTEWWYYTGNLRSADGRAFGFQLTFFRNRLVPSGREKTWPNPASAWRTAQVFLAHAAVTDVVGKRHLFAERTSRSALGMAGAEQTGDETRIFLHSWSANIQNGRHRLQAAAADFSIDLRLAEDKPAVFHGDQGYSRKGSDPGRASCYYSLTRLISEGEIGIEGRRYRVSGTAWMDHEFGSETLEPGIVGWDWFSLQLSDRSDIMIYLLRKKDGGYHSASGGSWVDAEGHGTPLSADSLQLTVLDTWKSPKSSAIYPVSWRIRIPTRKTELTIAATLPDQELQTNKSTRVTYWEGSIRVSGKANDAPVSGTGYAELTGYDKSMDAPL